MMSEVAAATSSSKESGTVGAFKETAICVRAVGPRSAVMFDQDREPLFASGSYLAFDAKDAEALHLEEPGTTGSDIRDEQRKLRASCRQDQRIIGDYCHHEPNTMQH